MVKGYDTLAVRTANLFSLEDTLGNLCRHLSSGGTIISYCRIHNIRSCDVNEWVQSDPARADAVKHALNTRREFYIEELVGNLDDATHVDVSQITDESGNIKPPAEWPEGTRRSVAQYTRNVSERGLNTSVKFVDKLTAIKMLGSEVGAFAERVEVGLSLADLIAQANRPFPAQPAEPVALLDAANNEEGESNE